MIISDYRCESGHDFEGARSSMSAPDPDCPACGGTARRRPSRVNTTGASTGPSREQMPRSWNAIGKGHPDAVRHWHQLASRREKLEEKHPELAGDRRPVLAHEGIFANRPLRAGEDIPTAIAEAKAATPAATPAVTSAGTKTAGTKRTPTPMHKGRQP